MELQYLLREPEHIHSKTPILLLLHGYASDENDLFSFTTSLPKDWMIISYRAPLPTQFGGYSWYVIDFNNPEKFVDLPQARDALNAILRSLDKVKTHYGLSESEVHLCGFSQGGILCYALALTQPEKFSKVACLSCYPEEKLLTQREPDKKKLHHIRFFISHGTDDAVIPLEWGRKAADLLYDLGCYFSFREYMSGHGVNQKNYLDLMEFFSKK